MQDSYRELFLSESKEYLGIVSNCLVKLEANPKDLDSLNEIFRCMHTLKGMSPTMGFEKITLLSHQMENLLDELRSKKRQVSSAIIDILFATLDIFEQLTEEVRAKQESTVDISGCLKDLKDILSSKPSATQASVNSKGNVSPEEAEKAAAPKEDTINFSEAEIGRLKQAKESDLSIYKIKVTLSRDCVLKEARAFLVVNNLNKLGELAKTVPAIEVLKEGKFDQAFLVILITKETLDYIQMQLLTISELDNVVVEALDLSPWDIPVEVSTTTQTAAVNTKTAATQVPGSHVKKIQSMRIPVERLDKIMNLMGELAIAKIRLVQISQSSAFDQLEDVSSILDRLISSLQDEIMQTRLLPAAYVLDTFPRMVRDLSRKQGKDIDLQILGSDIELDRVALDEISDPLVHLIRNAIDHGIEAPEERAAKKKNAQGQLIIQVSRQKGQIFIEISDDGRGVDLDAVKKVAIGKGLITTEEAVAIDDKKVLELITLPGFSTAKKVTDISGRGVGLDVVKSKIEALGGRLEFETKFGQGSKFTLALPLTLAIIKAMLVKVGEEIFAVPLMSVREIIKIKESELRNIHNFEVARIRDEIIPIVRLGAELDIAGVAGKGEPDGIISVIIIEYGKKALGLVVNSVLGEQDIVVKPLGVMIKRTRGIAGATILGDGRVALILDTMSLK